MLQRLYSAQSLTFNPQRLIAVGDIHGQYLLLKSLVENEICFDPKTDGIIFLGDYLDRGDSDQEELNVLNYLVDLANYNPGKIVLLRGNHEEMAINAIGSSGDDLKQLWIRNGGGNKLLSWPKDQLDELKSFCEQLPLYYETDDCMFVHAGAQRDVEINKQTKSRLLWYSDEVLYGYKNKKLVVGHTRVADIKITEHAIYLDIAAYKVKKLAAYDVKNGTSFYASM